MNLLEETINDIKYNCQTIEDIVFIGSLYSGHCCDWGEFEALANIEYNEGFGSAEIASDLVIVFANGARMTRGEYDGSEWWEYHKPFVMPDEKKKILRLKSTSYSETLGFINMND